MALADSTARKQEPAPLYRSAPHNIEAEQALLGAILVNNEAFYRVSDFLEPAHFFEPIHQKIYQLSRDLIRAGADVIIPGEMPLNVLLAVNGVKTVDGVPILDGLAVTMKMAEAFADLHKTIGFSHSRHGFYGERPKGERLDQVLAFYGLDKLIK